MDKARSECKKKAQQSTIRFILQGIWYWNITSNLGPDASMKLFLFQFAELVEKFQFHNLYRTCKSS